MSIAISKHSLSELKPRCMFELAETCCTAHYALHCAKEHAIATLVTLRKVADLNFDRTSRIFRLSNEECLVDGYGDNLLDLKLQAQSFAIFQKELKTVVPIEISAFASELRNGQVAYFGFALYPETMKFGDETVTLSNSNTMHWRSSVRIANTNEFKRTTEYTRRSFDNFVYESFRYGIEVATKYI